MFEVSTSTASHIQGDVQDSQLMIIDLLRHAVRRHPQQEIVSRRLEGDIHRYTYRDCYERTCQLAHALKGLEIEAGERIATLAWNTYRHVELYYAVSGIGAVIHTVNPRLIAAQIKWILDDAQANWLFVDSSFVPLLDEFANELKTVKGIVILTDDSIQPQLDHIWLPVHNYESLIAKQTPQFDWPTFSENTAALLCYTSGTTGNPKGVLTSHRSTVLHAQATMSPE